MNLILIGYMGSGKSSIGKRLANRLGYVFVDLDKRIEDLAKVSIEEIFEEYGEKEFRNLEDHVLSKVLKEENIVLATGGGTPCHSNNIEALKENGFVVYLELDPPTLKKRLFWAKSKRPLLIGKNQDEMLDYIGGHLEERMPFYSQAHLTVNADKINASKLDEIKDRLLSFEN